MKTADILKEVLMLENAAGGASILGIALNAIFAALLAGWIASVYVKYGKSLSNRRVFSRNFILLTMTTMLMISIIKSNIALSLGLIGALSIVRFRTAIKEPEELSYLFLSIAVGLGLGANLRLLTVVSVAVIIAIIVIKERLSKAEIDCDHNMILTVTTRTPQECPMDKIHHILNENCSLCSLKRLDKSDGQMDASFIVELDKNKGINDIDKAIRGLDPEVKLSFLDFAGSPVNIH